MVADDEIVQSFIVEARELLEGAERSLVELQSRLARGAVDEADALETVNLTLQTFHSLKGGAVSFGLPRIADVAHNAESLLGALRPDALESLDETLEIILRVADFLGVLLKRAEQSGSDAGYEAQAEAISRELSAGAQRLSMSTAGRAKTVETRQPGLPEGGLGQERCGEPPVVPVTQETKERFAKEALENLSMMERMVRALDKPSGRLEDVDGLLRLVHSLKEASGLHGFREIEEVSQSIESVFKGIRDGDIPFSPRISILTLKTLYSIRNGVELISGGRQAAISTSFAPYEALEQAVLAPGGAFNGSALLDEASGGSALLGEILVARRTITREELATAVAQREKPLGQIMLDMGMVTATALEEALKIQAEFKVAEERATPAAKSVRVPLSKLDSLMNLVGELTVAAGAINLPDFRDSKAETAILHLQRISSEFQEVVMNMRMTTLSGVFEKLLRVAADVSRKNGKKADVTFDGAEIEFDRRVVELISDPLIHMVRNALDHGIEHPVERALNGKPTAGRIHIEAEHNGGETIISVTDDGQGLDREKILSHAVSARLIGERGDISDDEIFNLVFEPGFSTARHVTEISGRGVGMGVVRENVRKIDGRIDIRSEAGKWTSFIIRIPQTRAIAGWVPAMGRAHPWFPKTAQGLS